MSTFHVPLSECNPPTSSSPGLVSGAYANAFGMANGAIGEASRIFETLSRVDLGITPIDPLRLGAAPLPPITAATPAVLATSVVGPITERQLQDTEVDTYDLEAPPEFIGTPPVLVFPQEPSPTLPTPPVDDVSLVPIVLPTAPVIQLPGLPELLPITLPVPPDIVFPEFTALPPGADTLDITTPEFSWSEPGYSSELLSAVTARLLVMLAGGTGIPEPIWLQIIDRARDEQQVLLSSADAKVLEEWALRGFTLPSGVMLQRIDDARRQSEQLVSKFIRDAAIERAKLEIDNMRFAVERSISLETMLIGHYDAVMNRSLEAAKQTVLIAIAVIQARIATFQANWAVYKIQAEVYREIIQAELAKIQLYQAEIQAQGLIAQINTQTIESYKAQVQFYESVARIYTEQVRGAVALAELNTQKVALFAQRVTAYSAQIQSYRTIYEAWQTRISAETAKMGAYEAEARAYAARIQGYAAYAGAVDSQHRLMFDVATLQVNKFGALLEQEKTKLTASTANAEIEQRLNTSKVQLQQVTDLGKRLELDRAYQEASINIEEDKVLSANYQHSNDSYIKQLQFNVQVISENLRTAGQVYSQLAASAMSSVNMGASVQQSASSSSSCSKSSDIKYLGND